MKTRLERLERLLGADTVKCTVNGNVHKVQTCDLLELIVIGIRCASDQGVPIPQRWHPLVNDLQAHEGEELKGIFQTMRALYCDEVIRGR